VVVGLKALGFMVELGTGSIQRPSARQRGIALTTQPSPSHPASSVIIERFHRGSAIWLAGGEYKALGFMLELGTGDEPASLSECWADIFYAHHNTRVVRGFANQNPPFCLSFLLSPTLQI
jgi:hypothetical protein